MRLLSEVICTRSKLELSTAPSGAAYSATGIIGFILSMLGCVTPALVALLAAIGISGRIGWLDYILLPAMAIFTALVVYAIVSRKHLRPL